MQNFIQKVLVLMTMTVILSGCAGMQQGATIGTISGGALGGYLGSTIGQGNGRTAAMLGGAGLGAMMGNSIGRSMDSQNH